METEPNKAHTATVPKLHVEYAKNTFILFHFWGQGLPMLAVAGLQLTTSTMLASNLVILLPPHSECWDQACITMNSSFLAFKSHFNNSKTMDFYKFPKSTIVLDYHRFLILSTSLRIIKDPEMS